MKQSKKQIKEQIIKQITAIENNTFLFPLSWSDDIVLADYDWKYRTYNSGSVGDSRYHNIEIKPWKGLDLKIEFRGENIIVIQDLASKQITIREVGFYVNAIYQELHSFKNHSTGRKQIRKNLNKVLKEITDKQKEVTILRQRLTDSKNKLS